MMGCKKIQDRLFDLLAGELPEDDARGLREHLATCGKCRGLYEELKSKHELLRGNASALRKLPEKPCPDPEALAAFSEGRLNRHKSAQIEKHLRECPACKKAVAALKELKAPPPPLEEPSPPEEPSPTHETSSTFYCLTTAEPAETEPPEWFVEAVRNAFPEKRPKRPWWKRLWFRA